MSNEEAKMDMVEQWERLKDHSHMELSESHISVRVRV